MKTKQTKPTKAEIAKFYGWAANIVELQEHSAWGAEKVGRYLDTKPELWVRYSKLLAAIKPCLKKNARIPWL